MRVHTALDRDAMVDLASGLAGVGFHRLERHGSRTHAHGYDLVLSGNGARGTGFSRGDYVGATWDEWGVYLGRLFLMDPDARCGGVRNPIYAHAEHYHWATGDRFEWPEIPADTHPRHRWMRQDREYGDPVQEFECRNCTAVQRGPAWNHALAEVEHLFPTRRDFARDESAVSVAVDADASEYVAAMNRAETAANLHVRPAVAGFTEAAQRASAQFERLSAAYTRVYNATLAANTSTNSRPGYTWTTGGTTAPVRYSTGTGSTHSTATTYDVRRDSPEPTALDAIWRRVEHRLAEAVQSPDGTDPHTLHADLRAIAGATDAEITMRDEPYVVADRSYTVGDLVTVRPRTRRCLEVRLTWRNHDTHAETRRFDLDALWTVVT